MSGPNKKASSPPSPQQACLASAAPPALPSDGNRQGVMYVRRVQGETSSLHLSVHLPDQPLGSLQTEEEVPAGRLPMSVVCCVDVSGSMSQQATVKNDAGQEESNGLTQLDLVKHALRTVLASLTGEDMLSLVSFHSQATVELPMSRMTPAAKKRASDLIDALTPSGLTNIWDGLLQGMEQLRTAAGGQGNANLMLFTDGQPTVDPPQGTHLDMLARYRDDHQGLPGAINTYGFGYCLDSELLSSLAVEGGGTYAFIPDASLLGTVFVNSIANQLAKCARDVTVNLEEKPDAGLRLIAGASAVAGGYPNTRTEWGAVVSLGSAQFGQTRDAVLRLESAVPTGSEGDALLSDSVSGTWFDLEGHATRNLEVVVLGGEGGDDTVSVSIPPGAPDATATDLELLRLEAAEAITAGAPAVRALITRMKSSPLCSSNPHPRAEDLLRDVEGQVVEAVEPAAHRRWGLHYLPSLRGAHLLQQCNNFKDPGVQHYGGALFSATRDVLDKAFLNLPAPKPSARNAPVPAGARRVAAPARMGGYYNRGGGCFSATSTLQVLRAGETSATPTRADAVRKGDVLLGQGGVPQRVACVVRTAVPRGEIEMRSFEASGLCLTPYHPMYDAGVGAWVFPAEAEGAQACMLQASHVYDFVVDGPGSVLVNGVPCVTLGHSVASGAASHAYFGSARVVEDLARLPGFDAGEVTLTPGSFARDAQSNLVVGIAGLSAEAVEVRA